MSSLKGLLYPAGHVVKSRLCKYIYMINNVDKLVQGTSEEILHFQHQVKIH